MNLLEMVQFVQGNIGTSVDLPFAGPSTIVGGRGTRQLPGPQTVFRLSVAPDVDGDHTKLLCQERSNHGPIGNRSTKPMQKHKRISVASKVSHG